jgi:hypothetical protein
MGREKIYYWPAWFSKLLSKTEQAKIKKILPKLQIAQIFLWDALNIYDDFLDGAGKPAELPKANNYFRHYLEINYQLNLSSDYYKLFDKILGNLEEANIKEVSAQKLKIKDGLITIPKKLPNWKNVEHLSDKSLALSLSALALLFSLGYKTSDKKIKASLNFFKCALAAKQLADDSYDWLEDLKNGSITTANTPILKAAKRQKIKLNFKNEPEILYLLFAQESSPILIAEIENLCKMARKEMKKINNQPNNILLAKLIFPLEKSCQESKDFTQSVLGA